MEARQTLPLARQPFVEAALHNSSLRQSAPAQNNKVQKLSVVDVDIEWDFTPSIEPGEYHAISRRARTYFDRRFKRHVCAVEFDILGAPAEDGRCRLVWYLNLGSKDKPKAIRRSNYWSAWLQANGRPPKRSDRLSPRAFEGRAATLKKWGCQENS